MPTVFIYFIFFSSLYYDDDTIEWNTPHLYNVVLYDGLFYFLYDEWNRTKRKQRNLKIIYKSVVLISTLERIFIFNLLCYDKDSVNKSYNIFV